MARLLGRSGKRRRLVMESVGAMCGCYEDDGHLHHLRDDFEVWYSILSSAPDGERVNRSKHVEQEKPVE